MCNCRHFGTGLLTDNRPFSGTHCWLRTKKLTRWAWHVASVDLGPLVCLDLLEGLAEAGVLVGEEAVVDEPGPLSHDVGLWRVLGHLLQVAALAPRAAEVLAAVLECNPVALAVTLVPGKGSGSSSSGSGSWTSDCGSWVKVSAVAAKTGSHWGSAVCGTVAILRRLSLNGNGDKLKKKGFA